MGISMKKIIICVFLFLLLLPCLFGQQAADFEWFVDDYDTHGVIIAGYVGTSRETTIPGTINGMPVTIIGSDALKIKQLTNVTIPNSVISINTCAFESNFLTSVTIPGSVTIIEDGAFIDNQLTSVTIPPSVRVLGSFVFHGNPITSITIGENVEFGRFTHGRNEKAGVLGFDDNSFDLAYISGGSLAGTYTRPNAESKIWTRR
jgi:hypothetical protein